jgi:hypothetical protein
VDAQAHALCLVQTNAYPSQAEQQAAYDKALRSSQLSKDDLAKAQKAVAADEQLRTQVSKQVTALCG